MQKSGRKKKPKPRKARVYYLVFPRYKIPYNLRKPYIRTTEKSIERICQLDNEIIKVKEVL